MDPPLNNADSSNDVYLYLVLLPWVLGFVSYWVIVAVDPYHMRYSGAPVQLADHRYPDREWPRLLRPATAEPHDMVLLGGSTAMSVSPEMIQDAFPDVRNPINLSYIAPRPADMPTVLGKVAQIKGLRRVVLVMDFTLMDRHPFRSSAGESLANMATINWSHGGDFALTTALASIHSTIYGTYDLPSWAHLDVPEFMQGARPVTQSKTVMERFRRAVERHKYDVFAESTLTCDQIPYLRNILIPFLSAMAQQRVAVVLVFPPVPYVLYYDWIENQPRFNILLAGPVFDQFMEFKKCVIAARDQLGQESNRVIALDSNDSVSGDLRLYSDSAHLLDPDAYRTVMRMIAKGDEEITSANIGEHEVLLRMKVARSAAQIGGL